MEPRNLKIILAVVAALALGAVAGYAYRRHKNPTFEERMHDATEEMKSAVEKLTK
jgi:uncharacterized membrane protein